MLNLVKNVCAVALCGVLGACASTMPRPAVFGRNVEVQRRDAKEPTRGELVAVETDGLWVAGQEQVEAIPLRSVDRVRLQRHEMNGKAAGTWAALGAVITGGALTAACWMAKADGCGKVFLAVGGTWLVIGGPSAASLGESSKLDFRQADWDRLKPYARFPQGIPEGLDVTTLSMRPLATQAEPVKR